MNEKKTATEEELMELEKEKLFTELNDLQLEEVSGGSGYPITKPKYEVGEVVHFISLDDVMNGIDEKVRKGTIIKVLSRTFEGAPYYRIEIPGESQLHVTRESMILNPQR